jgi:hypothetical protein
MKNVRQSPYLSMNTYPALQAICTIGAISGGDFTQNLLVLLLGGRSGGECGDMKPKACCFYTLIKNINTGYSPEIESVHHLSHKSSRVPKMLSTKTLLRSLALTSCVLLGLTHGTTLTVSTTGGNASSPLLYGLMFEVPLPVNLNTSQC